MWYCFVREIKRRMWEKALIASGNLRIITATLLVSVDGMRDCSILDVMRDWPLNVVTTEKTVTTGK